MSAVYDYGYPPTTPRSSIHPLIPLSAAISAMISTIPIPGVVGISNKVIFHNLKKLFGNQFGYHGPIAVTPSEKHKNLALSLAGSLLIMLIPKAFKWGGFNKTVGRIAAAIFDFFYVCYMASRTLYKVQQKSLGYY